MRRTIRIFLSLLIASVCAAIGWFTTGLVGLAMPIPANDTGLGLGVIWAFALYAAAMIFGIIGFAVSMWRLPRSKLSKA
jgi:MFS family permease